MNSNTPRLLVDGDLLQTEGSKSLVFIVSVE